MIVRVVGLALALSLLPALPLHAAGPAATAAPVPVPLQHTLQRRGAQVEQLRQQVSQQESRSRRANERLERQEQAIADLQRQLEALRAAPGSTAGHP